MTTGSVTNVSSAGATLQGSFTGATGTIYETGFYWGTSSGNLSNQVTTDGSNAASGSFSCTLTSLSPSTTYYYKAYVLEYNGTSGQYEERFGGVMSFTTSPAGSAVPTGWLELPAATGGEDYLGRFYGSGGNVGTNRNYSYNYNYTWYASLWVAYPLCAAHLGGGSSTSSWRYNPDIPDYRQVNILKNSYGTMYGDADYSRGHQCPNADRSGELNTQTYYATNQTPQLSIFNSGIWSSLESAGRNLVSSNTDTVYVVTGPVYQRVGGNEPVHYLTGVSSKGANPLYLPVPNYYWKAFLKVKWSGSGDSRTVSSASAIGFWFEHKSYTGAGTYANYAVSVDQIEAWTGFDLFTNLPDGVEAPAEANTSWTAFQNF